VRAKLILVALLAVGAAAGWVAAGDQAQRAAAPRGKAVFDQYCASCHGAEGRGDGLSAAGLPIKPWNLTDGRLMNPLPDEFISLTIQKGAQAVGLSPVMPGWEQYLSREQIGDVVAYVRSLAVPAYTPPVTPPGPIYPASAPRQPILFSHVIHAGAYRIDCQYCHTEARRSEFAGLPSVERCMGCHKIVGAEGNPEITKLRGYWERKEPIPWEWLYKVPEFVYFPHKAHIRAEVACQTCHGRVETVMQIPAPGGPNLANDLLNLAGLSVVPPPLTMGWCIECHREQNATLGRNAPLDCVTCHH
jgi:mono/diheme cytochrome c family protein